MMALGGSLIAPGHLLWPASGQAGGSAGHENTIHDIPFVCTSVLENTADTILPSSLACAFSDRRRPKMSYSGNEEIARTRSLTTLRNLWNSVYWDVYVQASPDSGYLLTLSPSTWTSEMPSTAGTLKWHPKNPRRIQVATSKLRRRLPRLLVLFKVVSLGNLDGLHTWWCFGPLTDRFAGRWTIPCFEWSELVCGTLCKYISRVSRNTKHWLVCSDFERFHTIANRILLAVRDDAVRTGCIPPQVRVVYADNPWWPLRTAAPGVWTESSWA
ncbi:hypothetical protein B0H67DRAFT_244764 [Lasiosphaeris hirsuta]|uniref:Uncharacterized protein n=1 Tax=Lasiosphaeris hirsuta TaxID=260670 RepID=A0AA40AGW2_9PEZI|nr:hypothetical protein B0H67DRAFT_244764 [Lasiosphaeris hirsuta]